MKLESRMDYSVVPTGTASVVHVLLTITAPDSPAGRKRPALNLAAVLDRSGSMAGEKLDYAKRSTQLLLDQFAPDDRFSLVTFDDEVQPLVESATVSDPAALSAAIAGIQAGNCTNLSGGWLKGIELVSRNASEECVNAVLLLTDGQANAGIVNPDQLTALGQNVLKDKNIRTSCLGLGADFNEDLLKRVSEAAGGRFYYIESPDHAPEVFKEELGGLLDTVTQNVEVSLDFADGVIGVAQLTGHPWKAEKSSYRVLLGDFHAAQVKHVLLAVQLPALAEPTDMHLASLSMTYAELREGAVDLKSQKRNLIVGVANAIEAAIPGDPEVILHIGLQRAAKARLDAVSELDNGDTAAAIRVLRANRDHLRELAPGASTPALLENEARELERRADELLDEQKLRESRKFMVSESANILRSDMQRTFSSRSRHDRSSNTDGHAKS